MSELTPITTNTLKSYASSASPENREALRKNVREWVGQVFFGTLLKQMRSEMNTDNPFNGGKAGQTFGTQLDQTLISQWSQSSRFDVADKIAEQWTGAKYSAEEQGR